MDADSFIAACDDLLERLDELPERAGDFADSVREKVRGMRDWAWVHEHATSRMETALRNMAAGVDSWLES